MRYLIALLFTLIAGICSAGMIIGTGGVSLPGTVTFDAWDDTDPQMTADFTPGTPAGATYNLYYALNSTASVIPANNDCTYLLLTSYDVGLTAFPSCTSSDLSGCTATAGKITGVTGSPYTVASGLTASSVYCARVSAVDGMEGLGSTTRTGTAGTQAAVYANTTFDTVLSPFVNRGGFTVSAGKAVATDSAAWMDAPISVDRSAAGFYVEFPLSVAADKDGLVILRPTAATIANDLTKSSYVLLVTTGYDPDLEDNAYQFVLYAYDAGGTPSLVGYYAATGSIITTEQTIRINFTATTIEVKRNGATAIAATADTTYMAFGQVAFLNQTNSGATAINSVAMGAL